MKNKIVELEQFFKLNNKMKNTLLISACVLATLSFFSCKDKKETVATKDSIRIDSVVSTPLPSWNDGPLKESIIAFVTKVTKEGSPEFIPVKDRIATFDNDGTLLAEQPVIQGLFAMFVAGEMIKEKPDLAKKNPFKAIATKDTVYLHHMGMKELIELVMLTHTGMSEEKFDAMAKEFFAGAKHPTLHVPVSKLVYQPQVELLNYLRANGFKTYIVSGGTVEFMRAVSEEYYGIPPEQVIGSRFGYTFNADSNAIVRDSKLFSIDDKETKPVNIQQVIGKRPVFACGNERSGGDIYMLRYSQGSKYPSYQLLVNHNDAAREFAYQEKDSISLKWAAKYNFNVVDMQKDWKTVFVK